MSTNSENTACPLRFDISGMHCAACSSRIERVVGNMEGVEKISVNLAAATAEVWPGKADDSGLQERIMDRVAGLGFRAVPAADDDAARQFEEGKARAAADIKARLSRLLANPSFLPELRAASDSFNAHEIVARFEQSLP